LSKKWIYFERFEVGKKIKIFEKSGVDKKMVSFFESFGVGNKWKYFESFEVGKKMTFF
jgi:hypothetical protein